VLRRRRSGCRPRRRAPRAGRALSDFGDASTAPVLRDVVKTARSHTISGPTSTPVRRRSFHSTPISARSTDGLPCWQSAAATPTRT
jgi:hypothetical protein